MRQNTINAKTELYCIFGNPVRHSLSPAMHNAAFAHAGMNAVYLAFEPETIAEGVSAFRSLGMKGASVTIPFKVAIMKCCDDISPLAAGIGAVNTLLNRNGAIEGHNTDGYGAVLALQKSGTAVSGSRALVIGNGGSARAIAFTLLSEKCAVAIAGRSAERIIPLAEDLGKTGTPVPVHLIRELDATITKDFNIVINTTPLGMEPLAAQSPLPEELLHPGQTVFDIVYAPEETSFLGSALRRGCRTIPGKEMLLYQGVQQFKLWTGTEAPVEIMRAALKG
ncbi:MAG TPA: shikimate dehydrogenase [Spirochaetota bacterium]|nr:shikimate dehydrogenase [Spirochaetota bacterium]